LAGAVAALPDSGPEPLALQHRDRRDIILTGYKIAAYLWQVDEGLSGNLGHILHLLTGLAER